MQKFFQTSKYVNLVMRRMCCVTSKFWAFWMEPVEIVFRLENRRKAAKLWIACCSVSFWFYDIRFKNKVSCESCIWFNVGRLLRLDRIRLPQAKMPLVKHKHKNHICECNCGFWLPWLVLAGEREDGEMLALVKRKTMQLFQSWPWTN